MKLHAMLKHARTAALLSFPRSWVASQPHPWLGISKSAPRRCASGSRAFVPAVGLDLMIEVLGRTTSLKAICNLAMS